MDFIFKNLEKSHQTDKEVEHVITKYVLEYFVLIFAMA